MKRFKSILVGVDLSWGDSFVAEELSEPNAEAVRQALWLAQMNSAKIEFVFALDLSARTQQLLADSSEDEITVLDKAELRLLEFVSMAQSKGLQSDSHVVIGQSWVELIRRVVENSHDLVVVGTRHKTALEESLLGSTGMKLLRKCPCAVWVTKPKDDEQFDSVLVAHDLRPVGDLAMELGCSLAKAHGARLQIVHAAEYPEMDYMVPEMVSSERKQEYRQKAVGHMQTQLAASGPPLAGAVYFVEEEPETAILNCAKQHLVDLIVMGTVGRSGIAGLITGNTAERLLPRLPCSLLAVKPPGFETPVELDSV